MEVRSTFGALTMAVTLGLAPCVSAAPPYQPNALDEMGFVGVQHFVRFDASFKKARAAFDAAPTSGTYERLLASAGKHWPSMGAAKVAFDAAQRIGKTTELMQRCKAMARSGGATLRDRLTYSFLKKVAGASGWKGGPFDGLSSGDLTDLVPQTPRTDLEGLFVLSEVAKSLDLATQRKLLVILLSQAPKDYCVRLVLARAYMVGYEDSRIIQNGRVVRVVPSKAHIDDAAALKHCKIIIEQQPDYAPAYYYAYIAGVGQDGVKYLKGYLAHEKVKTRRTYIWASKELERLEGRN